MAARSPQGSYSKHSVSHTASACHRIHFQAVFSPLLQVLKTFKQSKGITDPYSQVVSKVVLKVNANAFQQTGVPSFEEYAAMAEKQGLVTIEGRGPSAKIRLKE